MYLPNSHKYDFSGRRRKPKKPKGEVYAKYTPPPFRPLEATKSTTCISYAEQRRLESQQYPSLHDYKPTSTAGRRSESKQYTGDYVIGIATLHKSNAVPVTNQKYAEEISAMIK